MHSVWCEEYWEFVDIKHGRMVQYCTIPREKGLENLLPSRMILRAISKNLINVKRTSIRPSRTVMLEGHKENQNYTNIMGKRQV